MSILLDSSAILALLLREPGWDRLASVLDGAEASPAVSAASLLETHLVLTNRTGKDAMPLLEAFLRQIDAQIVPFSESHWRLAAAAFLRYGKGRHKASLNFGDCIVYATAKQTGLPLLFLGDDFARTDVVHALTRR